MRLKLTITTVIAMIISVIIALLIVYSTQAKSDEASTRKNSEELLGAMVGKLQANEAEIERLSGNVSENCLAKARAIADMIALDPSKVNDQKWLEEMCKDLQVSEIHVIDSKGFITHSTVSAYIGFDMASGEQSGAFMKILEDPNYELAQEPQVNTAEQKVVQYAGVSRRDTKGFVQIGVEPTVLLEAVSGKDLASTLIEFSMSAQGYLLAINKTTGIIESSNKEDLVGKKATEVGFAADYKLGTPSKINGEPYMGATMEYSNSEGDFVLVHIISMDTVLKNSSSSVSTITITIIVLNLLLLIVINTYVSLAIVNGIKRIGNNVQQITEGNYDVTFNETNNKEFRQLSAGLNQMTGSIRESTGKMTDASDALGNATQTALSGMEEIQLAIREIAQNAGKQASDMDIAANNVNLIGDRITSTSQRASDLGERADDMQANSNLAREAMANLKAITEQVRTTVADVSGFADRTSVSAKNIADAVGMIDSVAKQTKLLSFNASIEAARAGDAGKGFGVVAGEIQHLADQSAKASAQITVIIEELMEESGHLVESMEQMEDIMRKQQSNLANADTNVGKMVGAVDATMAGIKEIEQLTSEIDSAKDSLTEIIASLASIAQSNAASTEQTDAQIADAVDVFSGMQVYADQLKEIASK